MTSKYAENGNALSGTPLARLVAALPIDAATQDVQVYVGDLRDVLESIGDDQLHPELLLKSPTDFRILAVADLAAIVQAAISGEPVKTPEPEPVVPQSTKRGQRDRETEKA